LNIRRSASSSEAGVVRRQSSEVPILRVNERFDITQFLTSASRAGGPDEVVVLCSAKPASGQSGSGGTGRLK